MSKLTTVMVVAITMIACGNKKSGDEKVAACTKPGLKLPAIGLEIDVPSGTVKKHSFGDVGHEVVSAATSQFLVEQSKDPDSLEDAKTSSVETFKNVQAETLADGYAVTYETESEGKTSYRVNVRRDIGGTSYKCWTGTNDPAQAKAVLEACKSLCK